MLKPKFDLFGSPGTHNMALKVGQNNLFVQKMDSAPKKPYIQTPHTCNLEKKIFLPGFSQYLTFLAPLELIIRP